MDFVATQTHYIDHMAPVYKALPESQFLVTRPHLVKHARRHGIEATLIKELNSEEILCASFRNAIWAAQSGANVYYMEHGVGVSGSLKKAYKKLQMFLCPNSFVKNIYSRAYPRIPAHIVGSPLVDSLAQIPKQENEKPVVAFSFHFEKAKARPDRKSALGFYSEILPEIAKREEYRVIGHGHPLNEVLPSIYESAQIEYVRYFADVVTQADLYVCDRSSTIFEFAALGRPVLLLNIPEYEKLPNHGLRFWKAATVGLQCDGPGELHEMILAALEDPVNVKQKRDDVVSWLVPYRGEAAQRAAKALRGEL